MDENVTHVSLQFSYMYKKVILCGFLVEWYHFQNVLIFVEKLFCFVFFRRMGQAKIKVVYSYLTLRHLRHISKALYKLLNLDIENTLMDLMIM